MPPKAGSWEVDPLSYPRCGHEMKIISLIHEPEIIERILRHLGLWKRPPDPRGEKSKHLQTGRLSWRISTTAGPDMKGLSSSTTKRRRWRDPSPASLGQLVFDPGELSPFRRSGINTKRRKSNLQRTSGLHIVATLPRCCTVVVLAFMSPETAQNRP